MSIPTGYEKLAVIGIAWKGEYAQGTSYKTMNGVYYKGSTYVALRDNPTGPPAADGANWQYLAKGFEQQLLSAVTALDTSGVLGQAGASVGGQALMDAIADKVMTKLIAKSQIVNNLLATEPGSVLDATQGKALKDDITSLYSDLVVDRGAVTGDFNNYRSPGIYRFNGEPSILNSPGSVAGNLEVIVTTGYVIQRITVYDRTHTRRYNGSVWTDWASYVTGADIQSGIATVNAAANGTTEFTVNFPKPFSKYPEVDMSAVTSRPDLRSAAPLSRDTQKVTGVVYNGTSASELSVFWIAIAK